MLRQKGQLPRMAEPDRLQHLQGGGKGTALPGIRHLEFHPPTGHSLVLAGLGDKMDRAETEAGVFPAPQGFQELLPIQERSAHHLKWSGRPPPLGEVRALEEAGAGIAAERGEGRKVGRGAPPGGSEIREEGIRGSLGGDDR